jgi:DNA-3-methyladenine glycosylase
VTAAERSDVRRLLTASAVEAAPSMLGAHVISRVGGSRVVVRLTEVEAYAGVGADPGSHAHRGRTARNATMFGEPGHAYVYFVYGMHWCLNVVAHPDGEAGGILLRAGEVVDGVETARSRRPRAGRPRDLARGPARLAQALGVDGRLDGVDLLDAGSELRLVVPGDVVESRSVDVGPRVGVGGAGSVHHWRFWISGDDTVSTWRPARARD